MKVYLLTDLTVNLGFGHYYRMKALKEAFLYFGLNDVILIVNNDNGILDDSEISLKWMEQFFNTFSINQEDRLIIDSYNVDQRFFEVAQMFTSHIYYIDDYLIEDFKNINIIHPSLVKISDSNLSINNSTRLYSGPEFIILRKELLEFKNKNNSNSEKNKVFVYLGAADNKLPIDLILKVLISNFPNKKITYISSTSTHSNSIFKSKHLEVDVYFNQSSEQIAAHLNESVFAVIAPGTILYEVLLFEVPFITILTSESQRKNLESVQSIFSFMPYVTYQNFDITSFDEELIRLSNNKKFIPALKNFKANSRFYGTKRIVDLVLSGVINEY
jgi:UDP-2,4-diacetamido-2,4,6-trideoxy-beta-L-altropyranose hydrolase